MLIYSENRVVPTDVNMMVIKAKDGDGYFYIHRLLYDQAVIINDIYGEDLSTLIKAITDKDESRADVDYFFENAPTPINVLGAFLLLVTSELTEFIDMVGAIHVMSGPVHLRNMLKVPYSMRNFNYSFSLSIKEEYQLAWDRFFLTTIPYTEGMLTSTPSPMNGVMTSVDVEEEEEQELTGYEEYGIDATALEFLMSDEDPFAELDELDDISNEEPESTPVTTAPIVSEEPEEPDEVSEEPGADLVSKLLQL